MMTFTHFKKKYKYNIYTGEVNGKANEELKVVADKIRERVLNQGYQTYEGLKKFDIYLNVLDQNQKNELFHKYMEYYEAVSETLRYGKLKNSDFLRVMELKSKYEQILYKILES